MGSPDTECNSYLESLLSPFPTFSPPVIPFAVQLTIDLFIAVGERRQETIIFKNRTIQLKNRADSTKKPWDIYAT